MYVSLETLQRAVSLVDSLAELDDPDGFAAIVLPGLAGLLGCDVLTCRDFSDQDRALLGVLRAPLIAALLRARSRQQAGQASGAVPGGALAGPVSLTDREIAILRLVAAGGTNSAIAHELQLSPRTVAKHLEHVYRKLGVSSRAAAVSRMARPGEPPGPFLLRSIYATDAV
jgi:DNA-binding CsgD family transcriptional regulator